MKIFNWVTKDTNIDFMKPRKFSGTPFFRKSFLLPPLSCTGPLRCKSSGPDQTAVPQLPD